MSISIQRIKAIHNGMKTRCYNPKCKNYSRYGDKGITICNEWLGKDGKQNFVNWALDNGYDDALTIDRIDGSKGYMPSNCRWATISEQNQNRRNPHLIEYKGEMKTLDEWAAIAGISKNTLRARIKRLGWAMEEAMETESLRHGGRIHYWGSGIR